MLWGDWNVCVIETPRSSLDNKEDFSKITPSLFTLKEGSTSHPCPLSSGAREKTALRCSEPLRYKVGGPSKVSPSCAGWDRLGKGGGEGDKSGMLLKPYNKYRAISYELDAYERKK